VVAVEPIGDEVGPNPGYGRHSSRAGIPLLELQFTTLSDLEAVSGRLDIHHLYYQLSACPDYGSERPGLYRSAVHAVVSTDGSTAPRRYKVFVPLELSSIVASASKIGTLDVATEVSRARSSGFCMRLGGGSMWGSRLESNFIRLPLTLVGDELRATDASQGGAVDTVPNYGVNATVRPVTPRAAHASRQSAVG